MSPLRVLLKGTVSPSALARWAATSAGQLPPLAVGPPPNPNRAEYPYTGTLIYQGMPILIEQRQGETRSGVAKDGERWSVTMVAHYGEFADTVGMDGDPIDVYVGPIPDAPYAYVVHQKVPGTEVPDEDKVILGVASVEEAEALYRAQYDRPGFWGGCTRWPIAELRTALKQRRYQGKRLDTPQWVREILGKALAVELVELRKCGCGVGAKDGPPLTDSDVEVRRAIVGRLLALISSPTTRRLLVDPRQRTWEDNEQGRELIGELVEAASAVAYSMGDLGSSVVLDELLAAQRVREGLSLAMRLGLLPGPDGLAAPIEKAARRGRVLRALEQLLKARSWTRPGAEQGSLFGAPRGPATATHAVHQHLAMNPGGHGVHLVTEHVAHHAPAAVQIPPPPPPAPTPAELPERLTVQTTRVVTPRETNRPLTTREARGVTYHDLATSAGEWEAAEIESFEVAETGRGEGQAMPVFKLPADYTAVTTRFSGGTSSEDMACELCGAKISRAYYILHHDRKLSMRVGCRCIENHADAIMPGQMEVVKRTMAVRLKPEEAAPVTALMQEGASVATAIARVRARARADEKFLKDYPQPTEAQEALWRERQGKVQALRDRRASGGFLARADYDYLTGKDYLYSVEDVERSPSEVADKLRSQHEIPTAWWRRKKEWTPPPDLPDGVMADLEAVEAADAWTPELRQRLAPYFPEGLPSHTVHRRVLPDYATVGETLATTWAKQRAAALEEAERDAAVRTDQAVVEMGGLLGPARAGQLTPEQQDIVTRKFEALPAEKRRRADGKPIRTPGDQVAAVLAHVKEVAERAPLAGLVAPQAAPPAPPSPATATPALALDDIQAIRARDAAREALHDLDRKHAVEHAEALVQHLRAAGGLDRVNVWSKEGQPPRVYLPGDAGFLTVGRDGTLEDAPRGRQSLKESALYPKQRRALEQGRAAYLAGLEERLNRQTAERVALVAQHRGQPLAKARPGRALRGMALLLALFKAGEQLSLFGARPTTAPPPMPPRADRALQRETASATGAGAVHQVRAHTRVTAAGHVVPVQAHQAHHHGGQGATRPPPPPPAPPARPAPDARMELPAGVSERLRATFQAPTFAEAQRDHGAENEAAHRAVTLGLARQHFRQMADTAQAQHIHRAIVDLHGAISARMTPKQRAKLGEVPPPHHDLGTLGEQIHELMKVGRKHGMTEEEVHAYLGQDRVNAMEADMAEAEAAHQAVSSEHTRAQTGRGLWRAQRGTQRRVFYRNEWHNPDRRAHHALVQELRHRGFQAHVGADDAVYSDAPPFAPFGLWAYDGLAAENPHTVAEDRRAQLALHGHPEHGDQRGAALLDPHGGRISGYGADARMTWATPEAAEASYHYHTDAAPQVRRRAAGGVPHYERNALLNQAQGHEQMAAMALETVQAARRGARKGSALAKAIVTGLRALSGPQAVTGHVRRTPSGGARWVSAHQRGRGTQVDPDADPEPASGPVEPSEPPTQSRDLPFAVLPTARLGPEADQGMLEDLARPSAWLNGPQRVAFADRVRLPGAVRRRFLRDPDGVLGEPVDRRQPDGLTWGRLHDTALEEAWRAIVGARRVRDLVRPGRDLGALQKALLDAPSLRALSAAAIDQDFPVAADGLRHDRACLAWNTDDERGFAVGVPSLGCPGCYLSFGGNALYARALLDPVAFFVYQDMVARRPGTPKAERLHGGRADGMDPRAFDPAALAEGTQHELEHTTDERVAQEIAMDHLAEDPGYYRKLRQLRKAGPVANRPGLHLDPMKHRWVKDEPEHRVRVGGWYVYPGKIPARHSWRANQHGELGPKGDSYWTAQHRDDALHYLEDWGQGSSSALYVHPHTGRTLDLTEEDWRDTLADKVAEDVGADASELAQHWRDEDHAPWDVLGDTGQARDAHKVVGALRERGYTWAKVIDQKPANATTYRYLGDEPNHGRMVARKLTEEEAHEELSREAPEVREALAPLLGQGDHTQALDVLHLQRQQGGEADLVPRLREELARRAAIPGWMRQHDHDHVKDALDQHLVAG